MSIRPDYCSVYPKRVLVVGESKDARYCRRLRRTLNAAGDGSRTLVSLLPGFEVVSVDGIGAVEVVLVRNVKTGRLVGINTGAMLFTTPLASGIFTARMPEQSQPNASG